MSRRTTQCQISLIRLRYFSFARYVGELRNLGRGTSMAWGPIRSKVHNAVPSDLRGHASESSGCRSQSLINSSPSPGMEDSRAVFGVNIQRPTVQEGPVGPMRPRSGWSGWLAETRTNRWSSLGAQCCSPSSTSRSTFASMRVSTSATVTLPARGSIFDEVRTGFYVNSRSRPPTCFIAATGARRVSRAMPATSRRRRRIQCCSLTIQGLKSGRSCCLCPRPLAPREVRAEGRSWDL